MQVIINGLLTTYNRTGKGRQVLVLHGWGDTATSWGEMISKLAQEYEVVAPDLPGFGGTQAPHTAWSLNEYAIFVRDFCLKINFNPDIIIGHSNGGAVILRGVAMRTLQPKKIVLLASAGVRGEYSGRSKVLRIIAKTGKILLSPLPKTFKQRLRRQMYQKIGSDLLVAEHMQDTFKKIVADDVRTDAKLVAQPTLLIYGQNDEQTPPSWGKLLHECMSNSTFEVLKGADHFLYLSAPKQTLALIKEFIA